MDDSYKRLLLANKAWVQDKLDIRRDFFEGFERDQKPDFLWIGCSDSRVPPDEIAGTQPGEMFVHRNIANLMVHSDINTASVVQYAVEVLKVKHVIVCGHYGCGGIRSALERVNLGVMNQWLRHIKDVYRTHREEIDAVEDLAGRHRKLVELNVVEQVRNLASSATIQRTWRDHGIPCIHGWVYDINTGYLKQITSMEPGDFNDPIYLFDWDKTV